MVGLYVYGRRPIAGVDNPCPGKKGNPRNDLDHPLHKQHRQFERVGIQKR